MTEHEHDAVKHERAISFHTGSVATHPIDWPITFQLARRIVWFAARGRAWEIVAITISGFVIVAEYPGPDALGALSQRTIGAGPREHRAFRSDALAYDVQRAWDSNWDPEAWS